ncbi:MAG: tetratricopeptide repeat protein [bacterium]|nr:tetratricopeptide repeat protein [bacterium]
MLKFKSICVLFVLSMVIVFLPSCTENSNLRYISDKDTTYSADIRSVSEKINKSPNNAELYYKRANTFYFESNIKQAVLDIDYAITIDSTNPLYEFKRAEFLISGDTANSKEAILSFKKSLRLKPDYVEAMLMYGKLLIARQDYVEAEKIYFNCNKVDPSNPATYFYLGLMAKEMKDTVKALALFEKTLVYDGNYYDAIMQLGDYYAFKNDKKALVFYDRAMAINPYSEEPLYGKGLYLQKNHQYKDASAIYEEVAKMNPGHILCRYNLAYINAYFKNYKVALDILDETIDLDKNNADAFALRGLMKEKLNNHTGAMMDYQNALQLDKKQIAAEEGLKRLKYSISF